MGYGGGGGGLKLIKGEAPLLMKSGGAWGGWLTFPAAEEDGGTAVVVFGGMTSAEWPAGLCSLGEQKNGFVTESLSASQSDGGSADSCAGLMLLLAVAAVAVLS